MLYQLVLITNLGMITPLATFNDQVSCLRERAMIARTAQYSAECLPTQNPEEVKKQVQAQMKMMTDILQELQKSIK
jgi:hypothetical protein